MIYQNGVYKFVLSNGNGIIERTIEKFNMPTQPPKLQKLKDKKQKEKQTSIKHKTDEQTK